MSKDYLKNAGLGTKVINIGIDSDPAHGAVMPPIYLTTNYTFEGFGKKRTYDYGRSGNPNRGKSVFVSRKNVSSATRPSEISTTCNAHGS